MKPIMPCAMLLALALAIVPGGTDAATMYRWTDENGTVHFGDAPPDGVDATPVNVDSPMVGTVAPEPAPAPDGEDAGQATQELSIADQRRQERALARAERTAERQQVELKCEAMRQQLDWAEPRPRVIVQTPDGPQRMDDDERLALVDEAKTYIAENCD